MYNNKYRSRNKEQKIKIIKTYNSYNMKQSNFTKLSTLLLAIVLTISANQLFAQTTNGIFFQAVARDNFSNPAKDRKIFVQTSIIQTTVTGTKVLTEEHQANTDATGVFSVSIGNGTRVGGTAANLNGIDWSKGPFFLNLKVSITPIGSSASWDYTKEWVDMGTTSFGAVPFSFFAANVAGFDTKVNVSDSAKMLLPYAKTTAVTSLYTNVDTKLSTKLNVADSAKYVTPTQLAAKTFDTTSLSNRINLKAVATEVTTSLNNKLNIADSTNGYVTPTQLAAKTFDQTPITNAIASKLNIADSATKYVTPAQLASYNFSTGAVTIDTSNLSNRINLKADASAVTISLNLKANASDVTSALNLKANVADLTAGLALKVNASQLGIANGIATLNSSGIIPSSQLPPVTLSSTSVVGSDADMMALSSATVGSIAIRTDLNKNYVLSATPASTLSNWVELLTPAAPVQTVNGYTGAVNIAKSDIGLGNVDNTSDVTKPVSNPTQAALNLKLDANKVGVATGVASLNALGKVPTDQIPAISFSSVKVLSSQAAMLSLSSAVIGSVVIRTDVNKNYVLAANDPSVLANWIELLTPAPPVQTVNGYSGNVTIAKSDIGLGNVDNTTDASKPVSTATQSALDLKANSADINTALNLKANLASPTFTGIVSTNAINTGALSSTSVTAPTYASTPKTLTYTGSTINWNPAQGLNAAITLTQNSALSFTSAPPIGSYGTVVLTQDVTGGRTITLPSFTGITNKILGSTSTTTVALSAAANAKDILNFYYDGTICYWNIGQGYGAAATASSVTTNLATGVTGTLAITNGGTGATSATTALTNLGAAPLASPTFTGTVTTGSINTGALTATSVNTPIYASTPQALTDGSTISWNPALGLNASVTLNGNRTLSFTSTPTAGAYGTLVVTQGTGNNTLTLPTIVGVTNKVLGSTSTSSIALSSSVGAKDIINFYFEGSNIYWNVGQGYGNAASFTATNIAGGASGSIPYQTGSGATSLLAKGTDGQILTLASGLPIWTAAPVTGVTSASSPLSISSNALSLGTVPVANGGTGVTTTPSNGQIDIGNGTGFSRTTLTAGTGISITNTSGAITIASSGTTGVPYTGANQAVNLGAYDLKVNGLTIGLGAGSMSNTVTGIASLSNNTTGNYNVAIGNNTLLNNTLGSNSTAVGYNSQSQNTYGTDNGSFGYNSLISNTTGSYNNAFGGRALNANTTGWFNTAIGRRSLYTNSTGNHNTAIGNYAGVAVGNLENATAIGDSAIVSNSNTIQLGNTLVTNVNTSGTLTAGTVTYPNTHAGTSGQVLTSLGSGTLSWTASAVSKPTSDQFTATAGQTSFTLTQTPITNTTVYPNIKPNVWMYINGTRTNNSAYSISGTTVTYTASANNSYTLVVGDRIQFDYAY